MSAPFSTSLGAGAQETIFVIEDDPASRRALGRLLEVNGYSVKQFATAEELLNCSIFPPACCLIIDVQLPGLNGLELRQALCARQMDAPVIFITGYGDIPTAVRAVRSGAAGFLTKPFTEFELLSEIKLAIADYRALSSRKSEVATLQKRFEQLTSREKEILSWVVSGKLNKETAADLGIVENTVKVHRGRIMRKMQAESIQQLVLMAQKLHLAPASLPAPALSA